MTFNYSNTTNGYLTDRFNSLLKVEENGIPKLQPYNDDKRVLGTQYLIIDLKWDHGAHGESVVL